MILQTSRLVNIALFMPKLGSSIDLVQEHPSQVKPSDIQWSTSDTHIADTNGWTNMSFLRFIFHDRSRRVEKDVQIKYLN